MPSKYNLANKRKWKSKRSRSCHGQGYSKALYSIYGCILNILRLGSGISQPTYNEFSRIFQNKIGNSAMQIPKNLKK